MFLRLSGHREDNLDGKPLPARVAAKLAKALAAAMQLAHSRTVVHGDLEPADFLVRSPFPSSPKRHHLLQFAQFNPPLLNDLRPFSATIVSDESRRRR